MSSLGRFALLAIILLGTAAAAPAQSPQPPCGGAAFPPYPEGSEASIRAWDASDLPQGWAPPACTGWQSRGARMVVALSGSFEHRGSVDELIQRFAAVSTLGGTRYWSVSDKKWRTLVVEAAALEGRDPARRRADFTPAELSIGKPVYFVERDTRSSGDAVYAMRLLEATRDRFVLAVDNATPIRMMLFTLFAPGSMQSVYIVERHGDNRWGYYSLMRAAESASSMVGGHAASYMNRAQSLYRHFLGEPTDRNPPAAL